MGFKDLAKQILSAPKNALEGDDVGDAIRQGIKQGRDLIGGTTPGRAFDAAEWVGSRIPLPSSPPDLGITEGLTDTYHGAGDLIGSIGNAGTGTWNAVTNPVETGERFLNRASEIPGDIFTRGRNAVMGTPGQAVDFVQGLGAFGTAAGNWWDKLEQSAAAFKADPNFRSGLSFLGTAISGIEIPLDGMKENLGNTYYDIARTQGKGGDFGGLMDQFAVQAFNNQDLALAEWVRTHPESWPVIMRRYEEGGARAVWEFVIGQQSRSTRIMLEIAYDPLTYTVGGGAVAKGIKGTRTFSELNKAEKVAVGVAEAIGGVDTAQDAIVTGPVRFINRKTNQSLSRGARFAGQQILRAPGAEPTVDWIAKLFQPSERQRIENANDEVQGILGRSMKGLDELGLRAWQALMKATRSKQQSRPRFIAESKKLQSWLVDEWQPWVARRMAGEEAGAMPVVPDFEFFKVNEASLNQIVKRLEGEDLPAPGIDLPARPPQLDEISRFVDEDIPGATDLNTLFGRMGPGPRSEIGEGWSIDNLERAIRIERRRLQTNPSPAQAQKVTELEEQLDIANGGDGRGLRGPGQDLMTPEETPEQRTSLVRQIVGGYGTGDVLNRLRPDEVSKLERYYLQVKEKGSAVAPPITNPRVRPEEVADVFGLLREQAARARSGTDPATSFDFSGQRFIVKRDIAGTPVARIFKKLTPEDQAELQRYGERIQQRGSSNPVEFADEMRIKPDERIALVEWTRRNALAKRMAKRRGEITPLGERRPVLDAETPEEIELLGGKWGEAGSVDTPLASENWAVTKIKKGRWQILGDDVPEDLVHKIFTTKRAGNEAIAEWEDAQKLGDVESAPLVEGKGAPAADELGGDLADDGLEDAIAATGDRAFLRDWQRLTPEEQASVQEWFRGQIMQDRKPVVPSLPSLAADQRIEFFNDLAQISGESRLNLEGALTRFMPEGEAPNLTDALTRLPKELEYFRTQADKATLYDAHVKEWYKAVDTRIAAGEDLVEIERQLPFPQPPPGIEPARPDYAWLRRRDELMQPAFDAKGDGEFLQMADRWIDDVDTTVPEQSFMRPGHIVGDNDVHGWSLEAYIDSDQALETGLNRLAREHPEAYLLVRHRQMGKAVEFYETRYNKVLPVDRAVLEAQFAESLIETLAKLGIDGRAYWRKAGDEFFSPNSPEWRVQNIIHADSLDDVSDQIQRLKREGFIAEEGSRDPRKQLGYERWREIVRLHTSLKTPRQLGPPIPKGAIEFDPGEQVIRLERRRGKKGSVWVPLDRYGKPLLDENGKELTYTRKADAMEKLYGSDAPPDITTDEVKEAATSDFAEFSTRELEEKITRLQGLLESTRGPMRDRFEYQYKNLVDALSIRSDREQALPQWARGMNEKFVPPADDLTHLTNQQLIRRRRQLEEGSSAAEMEPGEDPTRELDAIVYELDKRGFRYDDDLADNRVWKDHWLKDERAKQRRAKQLQDREILSPLNRVQFLPFNIHDRYLLDASAMDPDLAHDVIDMLEEAVHDWSNLGYSMPKNLRFNFEAGDTTLQSIYWQQDVLEVNLAKADYYKYIQSSYARSNMLFRKRYAGMEKATWFSSAHPNHVFNHEMVHHLHVQYRPDDFVKGIGKAKLRVAAWAFPEHHVDTIVEDVMKEVSGRAAHDVDEFVAEVGAGFIGGKRYPKWVMDAYDQLGGPPLEPSRGPAVQVSPRAALSPSPSALSIEELALKTEMPDPTADEFYIPDRYLRGTEIDFSELNAEGLRAWLGGDPRHRNMQVPEGLGDGPIGTIPQYLPSPANMALQYGQLTTRHNVVSVMFQKGFIDQEVHDWLLQTKVLESGREVRHIDTIYWAMANSTSMAQAQKKAMDMLAIPVKESSAFFKVFGRLTNMMREAMLMNFARGMSAMVTDNISNTYVTAISGNADAIPDALRYDRIYNMAQVMMGKKQGPLHELIDVADANWGVIPGEGVVQMVNRDLLSAMESSAWEQTADDFLVHGPNWIREKLGKEAVGSVDSKKARAARFATKSVSTPIIRALRHAGDVHNRVTIWYTRMAKETAAQRELFWESLERRGTNLGKSADEIRAWRDQLSSINGGEFKASDVKDITGDVALSQEWLGKLNTANKAATKEVNRVLFNYRMTKLDEGMRNVFLFHYWQTRAVAFHASTTLRNPYLLTTYFKAWEGMERDFEREGLPEGEQAFFRFMSGNAYAGIMDPLAIAVPMTIFREWNRQSYGQDEAPFDKALNISNLFLNPLVQAALSSVGLSTQRSDALGLGTSSSRAMIQRMLNQMRNQGLVPGFDPGLTPDPVAIIEQRMVEWLNEGFKGITPIHTDIKKQDWRASARDDLNEIIIHQAELEWGPYGEMDPDQQREIWDAQAAILLEDWTNARAMKALRAYSSVEMVERGVRAFAPGNVQFLYTPEEHRDLLSQAGFDLLEEGKTPNIAQQSAMSSSQQASAGSLEAIYTVGEQNVYNNIGGFTAKGISDTYWDIYWGKVIGDDVVQIGETFLPANLINSLSADKRQHAANVWLDQDPERRLAFEKLKEQKSDYLASAPALQQYRQYKDAIEEMGDKKTARMNFRRHFPQFARREAEQRDKLIRDGLEDDALELALDDWLTSTDAYLAVLGAQETLRAEPPLPSPPAAGVSFPTGGGSQAGTGSGNAYGTGTGQSKLHQEVAAYLNGTGIETPSVQRYNRWVVTMRRLAPHRSTTVDAYLEATGQLAAVTN